jgi:signal transduction histidine kinase
VTAAGTTAFHRTIARLTATAGRLWRPPSQLPERPRARAERLIAGARVVLAGAALMAIWFDPSEPARYGSIAYTLLAFYFVYAVVMASWISRLEVIPERLGILAHVYDLLIFTVFQFFTEGATSPFFVYFVFSMVCATLRWQWRGLVWTVLAASTAFVGMGAFAAHILRDHEFELNRFIIRAAYLLVMAVLLGYLGAYEERRRIEMVRLAAWPRLPPGAPERLVRSLLEHAAQILRVPRAVMVWDPPEEPSRHVAALEPSGFEWTLRPPNWMDPLVDSALTDASFASPDAQAAEPVALVAVDEVFTRRAGPVMSRALCEQYGVTAVIALRLAGSGWSGRLFLLDRSRLSADDVVTGEVVAREVSASLDHFYLLRQLQEAAAVDERLRVARDLHDGILQYLTGTALQLEALRRRRPDVAGDLVEVQRLIAAGQKDLRSLIAPLKGGPSPAVVPAEIGARVRALAEQTRLVWGLHVELTVDPLVSQLPTDLAEHVYHIVSEALLNAARHAGARRLDVEVDAGADRVRISVADDGRGFPFHGQYGLDALDARALGPVTLKQRVRLLGGELSIASAPGGSRVEAALPLATVRPGLVHPGT